VWVLVIVAALLVGALLGFGLGRGTGQAAPHAQPTASGPTASVDASTPPSVSAAPPALEPVEPVPSTPQAAEPADATALARERLDRLAIVDGHSDLPYDRARFGQAWADVDRNGCDTRNDVLGQDLLDPVFKEGTNDCKVRSGTLIDPYDGRRVEFASGGETSILVQIDHVVALGWAWRHGADAWTDERRTQFANDPVNLAAASQETNQEKSASGPSTWLPAVPELRCLYVENWIEALDAYALGVNAADRSAAEAVLEAC